MIKANSNKRKVTIKGDRESVLVEFTITCLGVYEFLKKSDEVSNKNEADREYDTCVRCGKMSKKELAEDLVERMKEDIKDALEQIAQEESNHDES